MIEIRPLHHLDASVSLPGSKSYTHRALIISALAKGESVLINALRCEDTDYTAQALKEFGISIFWEDDQLHVLGRGGRFTLPERRIFLGNSGTSMRFLTALASLIKGRIVLTGSERMRKRPMVELLHGLGALGVKASSWEGEGFFSVMVESNGLQGGIAKMGGKESSQFISGLLMVAPYAQQDVYIEVTDGLVSNSYIDLTLDVMDAFGIEVKRGDLHRFSVSAGGRYGPRIYSIEPDASSASYFFSAAAITKGRVRIENFNLDPNQADAVFPVILEKMGCEVTRGDRWVEVQGHKLQGIEIDMSGTPDLVPTVAVTAAFARGRTMIKNIAHLRLKESDRIEVLARELIRMGIDVEEGEDWLRIEEGKGRGVEIDPRNDHRIAMSFAVAGLIVPGIKIKNPQCVGKSFPDFWRVFERLYR